MSFKIVEIDGISYMLNVDKALEQNTLIRRHQLNSFYITSDCSRLYQLQLVDMDATSMVFGLMRVGRPEGDMAGGFVQISHGGKFDLPIILSTHWLTLTSRVGQPIYPAQILKSSANDDGVFELRAKVDIFKA